MTTGSLIKVGSIAECCNIFDLHLAIIGLENDLLVFLRVAILHRLYCIPLTVHKTIMKNLRKSIFYTFQRENSLKNCSRQHPAEK